MWFGEEPIDIVSLGPAAAFVVANQNGSLMEDWFWRRHLFSISVAKFVFPALRMREKKYVYQGLFFGWGFSLTGVCFCYFILMPIPLRFQRNTPNGLASKPSWGAEE